MKIVELVTFLSAGGAERFVVDLSNQLSIEHDVYLVTILDDKKDSINRNFYRSEILGNVKYVNIGLPNGLKISSQRRVYNVLRKINPDIIHLHLVPTLKYSAIAIGLLSFSKKIFFSVHSDLHNGYDKGIFKLYCNTLGRINKFKISCLSETNYKEFKDFYHHLKIKCIANGRAPIIPSDSFDLVRNEMLNLRSNNSSILLLHVARCHPVKNQKLLVMAVNELVSEGVNIDLVIIGAGFDSKEGVDILSLANNRIHYIGTRKNIGDYMLNSDIFCLSSDFEGMPITLLEAGLAGVPAVSTPVCGAVDLIKDGINGFLSKSHSLEDYKSALVNAINHYDTIKANSLKMRPISPYTISLCAKKYIEYYNE